MFFKKRSNQQHFFTAFFRAIVSVANQRFVFVLGALAFFHPPGFFLPGHVAFVCFSMVFLHTPPALGASTRSQHGKQSCRNGNFRFLSIFSAFRHVKLHSSCHFFLMFSLVLGQRPDGSRIVLARPHGRPLRVGTLQFRNVFLTFGATSRVRTVVFQFLGPTQWYHFQASTSRLFLFFEFQPATVVQSPRVQAVAAPQVEPSDDSSSASDGQ